TPGRGAGSKGRRGGGSRRARSGRCRGPPCGPRRRAPARPPGRRTPAGGSPAGSGRGRRSPRAPPGRGARPTRRARRPRSALRLQRRGVLTNEGAQLVGHVEKLLPLLLVEGHREAAEAVHRDAALLADLDALPAAGGAPEALVLGLDALELCLLVVRHGDSA